MKFFLSCLCVVLCLSSSYAQRIRVNGDVKTHLEVPIAGVVVMAFDKSQMIKSYVTDAKGEFSFYVDRLIFDVLFYKPGLHAHTYGVNNKLDKDAQGVYISIEMDDSLAETAVNIDLWLKRHHLTAAQLDTIYNTELKKAPPLSARQIKKNEQETMKAALAEQKRFANYKETNVNKSVDNKESNVTTIRIGPDTYEMIISDTGEKKYVKNHKPITETTYEFETTRRYDGVLKGQKNVKHFDQYKPMEHVKPTDK